jgi:hypothetical protein
MARAVLVLLVAASLPMAVSQVAAGDEIPTTTEAAVVGSAVDVDTLVADGDEVLVDYGVVVIDDETGAQLSPAVLEGSVLPSTVGGFTKFSNVQFGDRQMTVRNTTGLAASVRTSVTTAVNAINQIANANLTFGSDVSRDALSGEIVVRAVASTLCGGGAAGCAQVFVRDGGIVDRANVEIANIHVGTTAELPIILHEFGHAMGLNHFDETFESAYQVMRSFVDPSMTSYRSGDTNGLRSLLGAPFGTFESATTFGPRTVTVQGWAIDPLSVSPVSVTVKVNGATVTTTLANGVNRGFSATVTVTSIVNEICLVATVTSGSAANSSLGCRSVTVPNGNPFGSLDVVSAVPGGARIAGWTIDPDTAAAIPIHVYVNGQWGGAFTADALRGDVGRAFPGYGDNHGFGATIALAPGIRQVCVYAINVGAGTGNPAVGCRSVSVAAV